MGETKKKKFLDGILDRIKRKIASWQNNILTPISKKILIKYVAQVVPSYRMFTIKIPSSLCKEIMACINRFWWANNDEKRSITWARTDILNLSKKEGGIGFRDMTIFNLAFLIKQAWKMV